jgi:hypothetical protein
VFNQGSLSMISPAALPILSSGSAKTDPAPAIPGETPENGGFAQLLARHEGPDPSAPFSAGAATPPTDPANMVTTAATNLPETGKVLPPVLPEQLPVTLPAVVAALKPADLAAPSNDAAQDAAPPAPIHPQPQAARETAAAIILQAMPARAASKDRKDPKGGTQSDQTATDAPADTSTPSAMPLPMQAEAKPIAHLPVTTGTAPVLGGSTAPIQPGPAQAQPNAPRETTSNDNPTPAALPDAVAKAVLTISSGAQDNNPAAGTVRVRPGLALAVDAAKSHDGERLAAVRAAGHEAMQPLAAPSAPFAASVADAPPVAPAPAARSERPADFTQIVDTLAAAREAANSTNGTQPVHVTLQHADFGKVSLKFVADQDGLSVAMASADPAFARAVQASAPAAQQQGATADSSANSGNAHAYARADAGSPQSQSQNPSSSRQAAALFRDGRNPASNPSRSDSKHATPGRRGLFA